MAELSLVEVELDNNERELLVTYLLVCTARGVAKDKECAGGKVSQSPSHGNHPPFARVVVPPEVTAESVPRCQQGEHNTQVIAYSIAARHECQAGPGESARPRHRATS